MYFVVGKGIDVSALQTSTEQVGHRVRTITTGGRARRRAKDEEIDNCLTYLDRSADELERHGLVVDSIAVDGRRPISGRVSIRNETGQVDSGSGAVTKLSWQQDFGWSATTFGPGAPPNGWFHLYADDSADPATVAEFVITQVIPKKLSPARSRRPGRSAVAS
jgi:hypothetical protein